MRLTSVGLTNFRSFAGIEIGLDSPRVLLAGLNGAGKSSVADAIAWALTGRCRGTDARGAGAEVLIQEGAKMVDVTLTLDGIGRVSRRYTEKGGGAFAVEGFTGTSQIQQEALYIKLGTTPEFLRAVLDTSVFLDLGHVEAKAMVLSLLGVRFTVEGFGKNLTLDDLDAEYKQAFEGRKVSKKLLAQCLVHPKPAQAKMPTLDAIDGQLAKLRASHGELQRQVGSVTATRKSLEAEHGRLRTILDAPVGEDLSGQIADVQAQQERLEAAMTPALPPVVPAKGDTQRLQFLRTTVEGLQRYEPSKQCVLEAGVPCKTPGRYFNDRLAILVMELRALDPKPEKAAPAPSESPLTAIRRQLNDLIGKQAFREAAAGDVKTATARLVTLRQELDALPDTAAQDAELLTMSERIVKGEGLLKDARLHWAAVDAYERALNDHKAKQSEADRLESLVNQLGPNGVRVPALAEAIGKFEAAVNPYVEPFGWKISFKVEPWEVIANGRPVETYSRSERYRIGIALQMGIAMLSGLKFAIVDEVDMLDTANRAIVTKMLLSAPLEQILILGTREPSQALPKIQGVLAYRLAKDGAASIISERSPT